MQSLIRNMIDGVARLRNRWGFSALALLMLSLGMGAATAVFSVVDGFMPHSAPYPSCDAAAAFAGNSAVLFVNGPDVELELRDRVSDLYGESMDAAGDGLASWSAVAVTLAHRALFVLLSAAALALLVACSNAARTLYARSARTPRSSAAVRVALASVGALSVAAIFLRLVSTATAADLLGALPSVRLDVRAIAFAICVSALVEARRGMHPRLT